MHSCYGTFKLLKMDKKRNKLEIIRDIIQATKLKGPKAKPTHILYKANLSYQLLNMYLSELVKGGLILEEQQGENRRRYTLTEKGYKYLQDYGMISGLISSYGLDEDS